MRELLDIEELENEDRLDGKTVKSTKMLMVMWLIGGVLGLLLASSVSLMTIIRISRGATKPPLTAVVILIATILTFGLLTYCGLRFRIRLNRDHSQNIMKSIPVYGTIFWLMVSFLIFILWVSLIMNAF